MKRTLILAVSAVVLSILVSCQKEESSVNGSDGGLFFSAIIDNPVTKTVVNTDVKDLASRGKVNWEESDEITIGVYGKSLSAVYKVRSIDEKGVAIFEKKSGDELPTSGVLYIATYGDQVVPSEQTYAGTVQNLPMLASSTNTNLRFIVNCALLRVNLKDESKSIKSIKSIEVSAKGTSTSYTLTCEKPESVSEVTGTDFFIALPGGTYDKFTFTNGEDKVCTKSNTEGIVVIDNTIVSIKFWNLTEFK